MNKASLSCKLLLSKCIAKEKKNLYKGKGSASNNAFINEGNS